jgi:type I site-specific restriction-modification system R (restriction) subunit
VHRSQYDLIEGLAQHLRAAPSNRAFFGVTGTPIEPTGINTRGVFDDHISIYDTQREVEDRAMRRSTQSRELVEKVRRNATIDWTMRENVRTQLRVITKRIQRKYGYPADKQQKATQTVLEQVELLGWEVAT